MKKSLSQLIIEAVMPTLEGEVIAFPKMAKAVRDIPSEKEPLDANYLNDDGTITIEVIFSTNNKPGASFDNWLHTNFNVSGSGSGPDGRDVWVDVEPSSEEMVLARIKATAKKLGLPPLQIRRVPVS